jgi:hypothetical protein
MGTHSGSSVWPLRVLTRQEWIYFLTKTAVSLSSALFDSWYRTCLLTINRSRWHDRKEAIMNFIAAVLIGIIVAVSGLVLNIDRPFLTNQPIISQAVATETLRVNPTAEFAQKELSKKRFRTLWNMFKSEPWRLSRNSG